MGLFGGDSSSSSTTKNYDKRQVTDNGATALNVDNSNVNFTTTDRGAVQAALNSNTSVVNTALSTNSTNLSTLMDTVKLLGQGALDSLSSNVQLAKDLASGTSAAYSDAASQASGNKTVMYGALAVVALIGLAMMMKKG